MYIVTRVSWTDVVYVKGQKKQSRIFGECDHTATLVRVILPSYPHIAQYWQFRSRLFRNCILHINNKPLARLQQVICFGVMGEMQKNLQRGVKTTKHTGYWSDGRNAGLIWTIGRTTADIRRCWHSVKIYLSAYLILSLLY